MALEDVAVLVRALGTAPDTAAALLEHERARWPRVTRVQHRSRANGRLFHRSTGLTRIGEWGLIGAVSRLAPGMAAAQLDWLYGHDATA